MAMPENDSAFPPESMVGLTEKYREHNAWNSGDQHELLAVYSDNAPRRVGVKGWLRKMWSGESDLVNSVTTRMHVNLPQEIARNNAKLLFSVPVTVKPKNIKDEDQQGATKAEERLKLICSPNFHTELQSGAESAAVRGGVFYKVQWNKRVAQHAFIRKVDAEFAIPTFEDGFLTSVAFVHEVHRFGNTVYRHVEDHSTDENNIGIITHALFEGTDTTFGTAISLAARPETARFAVTLNERGFGQVSTHTEGLSAVYVPNMVPSASSASGTVAANMGRSDFEGIEQMLDAYDEGMSSWMRDIRLGMGRIIVDAKMLDRLGAGLGMGFDSFREVLTPVKIPSASQLGNDKPLVEQVQFEIRTEDFKTLLEFLLKRIVSAAGYSAASFSVEDGARAMTATEIKASFRESLVTRDQKIRLWVEALVYIIRKALAVDAQVFSTGVTETDLDVVFPDAFQPDPKAIAEQNALDAASKSSSIFTRVKLAHPDLTPDEINKEVERIREENKPVPAVIAAPQENSAVKPDIAA